MCEHEVDSSEQSTCMYVHPHACARLYITFYEYHINYIIYGQDKAGQSHVELDPNNLVQSSWWNN